MQISSWFWLWKKFEHRPIFDEVIWSTKGCANFLGNFVHISKLGIGMIASKYNTQTTNSSRERFIAQTEFLEPPCIYYIATLVVCVMVVWAARVWPREVWHSVAEAWRRRCSWRVADAHWNWRVSALQILTGCNRTTPDTGAEKAGSEVWGSADSP